MSGIDERSAKIAARLLSNNYEDKIYIPGRGWFDGTELADLLEKGDDEDDD